MSVNIVDGDDKKQTELIFLAAMTAPPTLLLGIVKIIACYKPVFVDLFGVAYFIGYVLAAVTLSLTDWIKLSSHEKILIDQILYFFVILY